VLTPAFAEAYSRKIGEVVQRRLVTLSELDVKNCDKVQIDNVIFNLKHMLQLGMTNEERNKIVELTDLQVGLRYLKSQYLEKRIRGLQDIRFMIDRVQKTMHLQQYI
jgi:ubiquitin carboxyl-terminal hydrolase 9/24